MVSSTIQPALPDWEGGADHLMEGMTSNGKVDVMLQSAHQCWQVRGPRACEAWCTE